jgi:hypothetical protein
MSATLVQRRLLSSSTLTTEYNGIRIAEKGLNKQFSYFLPFEEVPSTPFSLRVFDKTAIILTVVCCVFSVILAIGFINSGQISVGNVLFIVCFAGIPAALTWFTRKDLAGFGVPNQGLILRADRPSRQDVQTFLQQVQQDKVAYLREMYFEKTTPENPAQELQILLWLKDHGAISDEEFAARKARQAAPKAAGALGFQSNRPSV